jgi:hypothetical protein
LRVHSTGIWIRNPFKSLLADRDESFVVVPSGTDLEGSITKAIFVVIFFHFEHTANTKKDSSRMTCKRMAEYILDFVVLENYPPQST